MSFLFPMLRLSLLLSLAGLFVAGCSDTAAPAVDPSVPLVFLTHPTTPPCCWTNAAGQCEGTDVDLARRIAARLARPLVVEAVAFEEIIPRLKAGTADFGIATITITEARWRDVEFSVPYATGGNCFLYRADGPRPRMSQIASLRVGAEPGTTGDLYLCNHGADPVRFARVTDAVAALRRGEVDAIFFDAVPLRSWAVQSGGRLVASPLETREGYGVAVNRRRPDVLAAANAVIAEGKAK